MGKEKTEKTVSIPLDVAILLADHMMHGRQDFDRVMEAYKIFSDAIKKALDAE